MTVPIQIAFEHIDRSDFIEARVREEAEKLARHYDRISSVRVVIVRPQHRQQKGDLYGVRLQLSIPGAGDIVINREPAATGRHEDMNAAIRDAFDAARRKLEDFSRRRQDRERGHT